LIISKGWPIQHLRRQSNFNTLMAVIGGVKHSNIDRLAQTRALLRLEVAEELDALTELLSYNNNYAKYRRALREVGHRFRIPIMWALSGTFAHANSTTIPCIIAGACT
jgi:hypothetical protein